MRHFITSILLCSSIALALTPQKVLADRFVSQAQEQLRIAALALGLHNFSPTHNPIIDKYYPSRGREVITLTLRAGIEYAILGVCDEDCSDIDLGLYNRRGELIRRDIKQDDVPIIHYRPRNTGSYRIQVAIPRCHAYRCTYGVGVYGRGTSTSLNKVPSANHKSPSTSASSSRPMLMDTPTLVGLLRQSNTDFVLIDARGASDFRDGHIPQAISLPHDQLHTRRHQLPDNRNTPLIFYCWHSRCGYSDRAAATALQLGYRRVYIYRAGIRGWRQAGYDLVNGITI